VGKFRSFFRSLCYAFKHVVKFIDGQPTIYIRPLPEIVERSD